MKDELVSLETAKIAKIAGFDWNDDSHWSYLEDNCQAMRYNEDTCMLVPTQSLMQRWMREVHNIVVFVNPYPTMWGVVIEYSNRTDKVALDLYETYEEALEQGLLTALKLIKYE